MPGERRWGACEFCGAMTELHYCVLCGHWLCGSAKCIRAAAREIALTARRRLGDLTTEVKNAFIRSK